MDKNTRKIKLHARYRENSTGSKEVPWLNVSGCWLEQLGFKIGDQVEITTHEKLLIIQPVGKVNEESTDYKTQLRDIKQTLKKLV